MRTEHPGCGSHNSNHGYRSNGRYLGGWFGGVCGTGSPYYLLCQECHAKYMKQETEAPITVSNGSVCLLNIHSKKKHEIRNSGLLVQYLYPGWIFPIFEILINQLISSSWSRYPFSVEEIQQAPDILGEPQLPTDVGKFMWCFIFVVSMRNLPSFRINVASIIEIMLLYTCSPSRYFWEMSRFGKFLDFWSFYR